MSRITNDEFLIRLGDLFSKSETSGSVFLTQKRLQKSSESAQDETPFALLFRATDGKSGETKAKKQKLSTVVDVSDMDTFWPKYTEVLKVGMSGLRKKDKKKKRSKK